MNIKLNLEEVYEIILDFHKLTDLSDKKIMKEIESEKKDLNKDFRKQIEDFNEKVKELKELKKAYLGREISREIFKSEFKRISIDARSLSMDVTTDVDNISDIFATIFKEG